MKLRLLDYIICPLCGSKFVLKNEEYERETKEIFSGELICSNKHKFPISDGIPRLIDPNTVDKNQSQTADSFTYKWKKWEGVSFKKEVIIKKRKWYLERYGWKSSEDFKKFLANKSFILDAGTGLGGDAGWFAELSIGEVFGIDISESIDIAYEYYGSNPNVHLIQADLTKLPFRNNFFDFISCDQVIHHTTNPEKSFKYLVKLLKIGGEICIYTYKKKAPIREFCDDYIREYSTNLSVEDCLKLSEAITKFGKSLSDLNIMVEVPEDIPILQIKAGKYDLQRFFYWNIFKCYWNDNDSYDRCVAVNFDWYHPKYAFRFTPEEVKRWFDDSNIDILSFDVIESGISVRGIKR